MSDQTSARLCLGVTILRATMTQLAQRRFVDFFGNTRRTEESVVAFLVLGRLRRTVQLA